jgi:hypothetical protein
MAFVAAIYAMPPTFAATYTSTGPFIFHGVPLDRFWNDTAAWTPAGVPTSADNATFSLNSNYGMIVSTFPEIQDLNVLAGNVALYGSDSFQTLSVWGTMSLPNANGGTSLTLGTPGNPLELLLENGHLDIENGAALSVAYGSGLGVNAFGSTQADTLNGTLIVAGSGSAFAVYASDPHMDYPAPPSYIGTNGGTGLLAFQNNSTSNKIDGSPVIGADVTSGNGEVDLSGGAKLSLAGNLAMANYNVGSHSATMYIDGAGSALTQTNDLSNGPTFIRVGSDQNSSAAIYIGTLISGGTLNTGTAGLYINATGAVIVGSGSTTGTLNANGDVTVDGGLLRVFSGSPFNLASGKSLHIKGGGTADFKSFNINGSSVDFVTGSLSYVGNLLVGIGGPLGADLQLDASRHVSLTGTTSVDNSHTLVLAGGALHTGSLTNNGTIYISSGVFTTGTATISSNGTLEIGIDGTIRNTNYGAFVASGSINLAGTLIVNTGFFYFSTVGDAFDILDWGTRTGTFSSVQLPPLLAGQAWDTSQLYTTGVISVVAAAGVPGDYNGNGIVDAADYTVWRDHLGQTFALPNRSVANTGPIAAADFTFWKSQFGQHAGSAAADNGNVAVPEPATLWLFLAGILTMCSRRRLLVP